MNAEITLLFTSPLVRIVDFTCHEHPGRISQPEFSHDFSINFTRTGNFGYNIGKQHYDIYSGVVLLENPETEYVVSHDYHLKDTCTCFCIEERFLKEIARTFLNDTHSTHSSEQDADAFHFPVVILPSTPQFEYMHKLILQGVSGNSFDSSFKIELLTLCLLQQIFGTLAHGKHVEPISLTKRQKDRHLETIERGKTYMLEHFREAIRLSDIAHHAYVSPFHFSRLFKSFTTHSPYQYLIDVRLHHAVVLLRNTSRSITEICFDSGFNSLEHFIATFTRRYTMSPRQFRRHHA